ncbi:hypothetical protein D3C83_108630 [compost metagenome]
MRPAASTASRRGLPALRSWFTKSTSRMAFLVTRPISMMKPMMEKMLRVERKKMSARTTPISDIGSDIMIATGWMKLPNWEARIR